MKADTESGKTNLTKEGALIVGLTKALVGREVDQAFDLIGDYLDKNELQVSAEIIVKYEKAGRIAPRKIIDFPSDN